MGLGGDTAECGGGWGNVRGHRALSASSMRHARCVYRVCACV